MCRKIDTITMSETPAGKKDIYSVDIGNIEPVLMNEEMAMEAANSEPPIGGFIQHFTVE